jgi:large subunit ribosomal protein L19
MRNKIIQQVEQSSLKKDAPRFQVGDTVDVHTRIIEGEKERIQVFSGTVIMKKGAGINETFTVRRIVNNEGVERIYPLHSPFIAKVVVKRGGETRRAKLFYLRDRVGKAVRLTEKRKTGKKEEGGDGAAVGSSGSRSGSSTSSRVAEPVGAGAGAELAASAT